MGLGSTAFVSAPCTLEGLILSPDEREEVKKVAHLMLERLKSLLVLDWRKRGDARARVRLAIEDSLDAGLPKAYSPALFKAKCAAVFEHLYENYQGEGLSTYSQYTWKGGRVSCWG